MKFHTNNYIVEMDLTGAQFGLHKNEISQLEKRLQELGTLFPDFSHICSFRNGILRYESETLLPEQMKSEKQKVLLVLGNPAINSVRNGMFFFSKTNGARHGFWGKLAKAGLVQSVRRKTRAEEALLRRDMILHGSASDHYALGLTTFYSFPTPGADNDSFAGVAGVEKLFAPIIRKLLLLETRRILSYRFLDNAIVVFTQKSSRRRFYKITGIKPVYWPIRGTDSSGQKLAELLSDAAPIRLQNVW